MQYNQNFPVKIKIILLLKVIIKTMKHKLKTIKANTAFKHKQLKILITNIQIIKIKLVKSIFKINNSIMKN